MKLNRLIMENEDHIRAKLAFCRSLYIVFAGDNSWGTNIVYDAYGFFAHYSSLVLNRPGRIPDHILKHFTGDF